MAKILAGIMLALAGLTAGARADCGGAGEVWARSDGPLEIRASKGPGAAGSGGYVFEGRLAGAPVWRVTADYGCSNGIPFCSVSVPMSSGDPVDAPETVVGEPGRPEYVVFADLSLNIRYAQLHSADAPVVKAEVVDAQALAKLGGREAIMLPDYFEFAGCAANGGAVETNGTPSPKRDAGG
jgi:hypothetical protein